MKIIKTSKELTKREFYKATMSPTTKQIKDLADGTEIDIDFWALFIDDTNDEESEVLTIVDKDGIVYATISDTFKKNFFKMVQLFEDEEFAIIKISGTTNAGRDFVNCNLAD